MPRGGIVHVGHDWTFFEWARMQFRAVPEHEGRFISIGLDAEPRYIVDPDIHVQLGAAGAVAIARAVRSADAVMLHGLDRHTVSAVMGVRSSQRVMWSGWGYDYYPATLNEGREPWIGRRVLRMGRDQVLGRFAARVDLFSAPIPTDFAKAQERFRRLAAAYQQFIYAPPGGVLPRLEAKSSGMGSPSVIIGNSATPSNRHLAAIDWLGEKRNIGDFQIIVPLAYGDPEYRELVASHARRRFGSNCTIIRDLLPLNEYQELLASCVVMVMAHRRQQALGNILTGLSLGLHVYQEITSPVCQFLRSLGVIVEDLAKTGGDLPQVHMEPAAVARNSELLQQFWGEENVARCTSSVVAALVH